MSDKMEIMIIIGAFAFCIVVFGAIIAVIIARGKRHAKKVRMLALMHGFQYEGKDLEGVLHDAQGCYQNWTFRSLIWARESE